MGALRVHRETCSEAIEALTDSCKRNKNPSSASAPPAPAVRGVACLIGGLQPAQEGDHTNDHVQRNVSFSNGVLTFLIAPSGMPNVRDNVFLALTPLAERTDRLNGVQ